MALNSNIVLYDEARYVNTKASEEYVHVKFKYPDVQSEWDGWVPVEYRRTGVSIPVSAKKELEEHLNNIAVLLSLPKQHRFLGGFLDFSSQQGNAESL